MMSNDGFAAQDDPAQGDEEYRRALEGPEAVNFLQNLNERPLEVGKKADDAVDFEDIGDDDLAEDEDDGDDILAARPLPGNHNGLAGLGNDMHDELPLGADGMDEDIDQLFGEAPSSPVDTSHRQHAGHGNISFDFDDEDEAVGRRIGSVRDDMSPSQGHRGVAGLAAPDRGLDPALMELDDEELSLQQRLFAQSFAHHDLGAVPAPPENPQELLEKLWPTFEKDMMPKFMELFPPKRARYIGKTPLRAPRPVQPTKIQLELAPDHEKQFKISAAGSKRSYGDSERQDMVIIEDPEQQRGGNEDELDLGSGSDDEPVGGVSWNDFQVACADWDVPELSASPDASPETPAASPHIDLPMHNDLFEESSRLSPKRQKTGNTPAEILAAPRFKFPNFEDPAQATAKIAKRVILDLNDPNLLVDEVKKEAPRPSALGKDMRSKLASSNLVAKELSLRYNISNDEAYEKLKQNHQNRVRNTLGAATVSHSMPALRLQWPYYKTKLAKSEARSFHRPIAHFQKGEPITFQVPKHVKKKHLRGKEAPAIYNSTHDLSLGDNSHVLLLEYSEEYPTMLSNFGMGSKLPNYYRKKAQEDTERPKLDIGELSVLLPNDTSPLTHFGEIGPGETTPTIYNGLFKAPIFPQDAKPTDFLMVRKGTGTGGSSWYLRNIEYLRVVGQQFPSIEVPPPGGRRVTTAAKNRLRMISYRLIKKQNPHRISVSDITAHVADSTDMQNRQKMKEFMVFSKMHKEWEMRPGEQIPDADTIRGLVTPEDVCLLESMQVGQQHLEDSGLGDQIESVNEDVDENKEEQSLEQQLAPWQTTKNFLSAAAHKAMLQLHGDGDPSGRGEAFSFLRTSMKGGFQAIGESVEDKLDAKKRKEFGGHSYNVAKQNESYRQSIRRIWEAQKQSLASKIEHSDEEIDPDDVDEGSVRPLARGFTPRSEAQTPPVLRRRDDETMSQFSRYSTDSHRGQVLRIVRKEPDNFGNIVETEELVTDIRVIKKYITLRRKKEADSIEYGTPLLKLRRVRLTLGSIQNPKATDDPEKLQRK